jgi:hypothetical protein
LIASEWKGWQKANFSFFRSEKGGWSMAFSQGNLKGASFIKELNREGGLK